MKHYADNPRTISEQELINLRDDLEEFGDLSGIVEDINTNELVGGNQRAEAMGFLKNNTQPVIEYKYKKATQQGTVADGYFLWMGERFSYRQVRWTADQFKRANVIANLRGGDWSYDLLKKQFSKMDLEKMGFNDNMLDTLKQDATALDGMLHDKAVLSEKDISLQPKYFVRVLVSIPVDLAIDAKPLLDKLAGIQGIEVDYGAN